MQDSNTPLKIGTVWGVSAAAPYITYPVPTPDQTGVTNGAASFTTGFPPNTFVPLSAGGAGPFGKDFNGLLKQITAGLQWTQAGGPWMFDSAFSTLIGGYPQGAVIASTTLGVLWLNLVDNNSTNPDSGGTNWLAFSLKGFFPKITTVTKNTPGAWSFIIPAGIFSVKVRGNGASGGGGGVAGPGGGGGGGGGPYAEKVLSVLPGDTLSGVIGAAGSAGTSASNGGVGGDTTLVYNAVTYTLHGGAGGLSANNNAQNSVAGGTAAGAWDYSLVGYPSGGGIAGYSGSGTTILYYAGQGGGSPNGGQGGLAGTAAGNPGAAPGGAGAGSAAQSVTNVNGGAGAAGQILIDYYNG